ncbi:FeoA family protein [Endomicrobium proavitum]|uniref:Ferrous iron transporter, protein A n=1 Tax=Endomicrobium proavitum TaxID=1408281 RepID=A0A0G3WKC8_9BACT|nr:FeoA family protein [Endomicrobium proavitum]AKL98355.1 ferrous iron transporter, protein A [Endomicrobium proavitum]
MPEIKLLSKMKVGEEGSVKNISSKAGTLKKRLLDMGCVAGCKISVKKLAPLGDPIEISVKNYSLSLRKNEADAIEVEVK